VDRSQAAQLYPRNIQVPFDYDRDFAPGLRYLRHSGARSEQFQYAVVEPTFGATKSGPGGVREALLSALRHGKARISDRSSTETRGHGG
jgi:hypothetical protein